MSKYIDWLIPGVCIILVWGATWQFIQSGVFSPFPLVLSISVLILVRSFHQHLPKWIAAKRKR